MEQFTIKHLNLKENKNDLIKKIIETKCPYLYEYGEEKLKNMKDDDFFDLCFKNFKWLVLRNIIKIKFNFIDNFFNNVSRVAKENKFGLIDKNENIILPIEYDFISEFYNCGLAKIFKNGKVGLINTNGIFIVPILYDFISNFKNNIAKIKLNFKWGLINTEGILIANFKYDYIHDFINGCYITELDNKFGMINTKGKEIAEPKFDEIKEAGYKFAKIKKNGKKGYLYFNGKIVYKNK